MSRTKKLKRNVKRNDRFDNEATETEAEAEAADKPQFLGCDDAKFKSWIMIA